MTGDGGVTPERLAQLVDGAAPENEAEREAVALMADVRGLAEPAPDAVRERVRGIAASRAAAPRGWRRWVATAEGRRRLALAGAPVAAAIVALAVAIPAMTRDDGGTAPQASAGVPPTAEAAGGGAGGTAQGPVATLAAPQRAAGPGDSATGPAAPAPEASSAAPAPQALSSASPQADGASTAPAVPAAKAMELDRAVARARSALEDAGATTVRTREAPDGTQAVVVAEVPADAVDAATAALEKQGADVVAQAGEAGTATVRATVTPGG